jgi:type IV secretory pathway VirB2 component (pilin)
MKFFIKKVRQKISSAKVVVPALLFSMMTSAHASITLPGSSLFCDLATALRSQWAPGIFLLILVLEGILYYFSPKGAMSKILVFVVSAGVVFGASTYLGYIGVSTTCT